MAVSAGVALLGPEQGLAASGGGCCGGSAHAATPASQGHGDTPATQGHGAGGGCTCGAATLASAAAGEEHAAAHQGAKEAAAGLPRCPVMDEPVNLAVSVPTDDGPVFFCCKECIPKYQANPDKYAAKVAAQREVLAGRPKVQVTCPVSGEPADRKVFIEDAGEKVYFCCKGCINKYQGAPEKYKAALANSFTYQTKCPVMGEDIDPQAFTQTAGGTSIYFCCKGCDKKLFADPSKYAPNLDAQGYTFDAAEMKHAEAPAPSEPQAHAGHEHGHGGHGDHDH